MARISQAATLNLLEFNDTTGTLIVQLPTDNANNIQEWKNSLGTNIALLSSVGSLRLGGRLSVGNTGNDFGLISVSIESATTIGAVIRAAASQTANLQEWQNDSGTVLTIVNPSGNLFVRSSLGNFAAGTNLGVKASSSTSIPLSVAAASGQAVDLTRWYASDGTTVLAAISSTGEFTIPALTVSGNLTVNGTTTNLNSTNLVIEDKNIILGDTTTPSNTTADGGGITLKGATDKTFNWINSTGAWTSSEPISAPSLIVTGSTVPANGIYLPAANTLGLSTNSTVRLQIDANGNVGIGSTAVSQSLQINKNITGNSFANAILANGAIQSDVTSRAGIFYSNPSVANATFTIPIQHFTADQGTIGASATVSYQYGFIAQSTLIGATNNYGFFGNIASGTNRWNFYANGTAANYFAGQTTIGSTSLTLGSSSAAQQFGVVSGAATNVGLVVRGAASQTGNLVEWQNSSGTILSLVNSIGSIRIGTTAFGNALAVSTANQGATSVGILLRGTTSQTADLLQVQDVNGNTLSSINAAGTFVGNVQDSQLIQANSSGSVLQNVPARVHPAETLLKQAVWWIDSAHSASSGQTITNLGWGGSALNVTNGSSASSDSNDAQYLAWDGINYIYLPNVANNYLSVPDAAALDITGDIDIRWYGALDDWTPSAVAILLSKWGDTQGVNRSYYLRINTNGTISLFWGNGSSDVSATSTVAPTITDGAPLWIRAALDVNNGASGNTTTFFTSNNGLTWTQLGNTVTNAGVTAIYAGDRQVEIGSFNFGSQLLFAGKFYRAQILNGIDGTPVLDVDTSQISSGSATSFTALTGQTVTINRSTSGRKTVCVTHPVWLFGTDDYMEVNNRWLEHTGTNYLYLPGVNGNSASAPDSAALDITGDIDIRVKVALDDWTPAATTQLINKAITNNWSYQLAVTTTGTFRFIWSADGINSIQQFSTVATGIADGATKWVRATLDVDNDASGYDLKFWLSDDGTTWTQLGTTITGVGTTSIFSSSENLFISGNSLTQFTIRGKLFRAQIYNGIAGTLAFDANFETGITTNLPTTFTESSANAATVTVNYSGTGYRSAGVVASTYVFPGNPNTFKLSNYSLLDFGATDDFTVMMINRQWATPGNYSVQYIKGQDTIAPSWYSYNQATAATQTFEMKSGATIIARTGAAITLGAMSQHGAVIDRSAQTVASITNGILSATTSISALGSLSTPLYTLRTVAGDNYELIAFAIFRRALTASEIATLNSYYQGRVV